MTFYTTKDSTVTSYKATNMTTVRPESVEMEFETSNTECPVCFHPYSDSGDHVPRFLPCFHTFCDGCVKRLLTGKPALNCPECKASHSAEKVRECPQNRHILESIAPSRKTEVCPRHQQEFSLFCDHHSCQVPICPSCFVQDHRGHAVVDKKRKINYDKLTRRIESVLESIRRCKDNMAAAKKDVEKRSAENSARNKNRKNENLKLILQKHESLEEELFQHKTQLLESINAELKTLNETIDELEDMNINTNLLTSTDEDIEKRLKRAKDIKINSKTTLASPKSYRFYEYEHEQEQLSQEDLRKLCGQLREQEVTVNPAAEKVSDAFRLEDVDATVKPSLTKQQMTYKVAASFATGYDNVLCLASLNDGSVVVICAYDNDARTYKLTQYNLASHEKKADVVLSRRKRLGEAQVPVALVEVKLLDKRLVLAVAYQDKRNIDFYDVEDLTRVVHSATLHHSAVSLGSAVTSPSTLYVMRWSNRKSVVQRLDFTYTDPDVKCSQYTEARTLDICCLNYTGKTLIVLACGADGLRTYNAETDQLEWSFSGKLFNTDKVMQAYRVTTDECNHVFVCDTLNACIHAFSQGMCIEARRTWHG